MAAQIVSTVLTDASSQAVQSPSFVEPYEETCDLCNQLLLDPYQTRCGHRLCKQCLTTHLQRGEPVMCPYNEEDCELISLSENDGSVYPDFYLLKNLKLMKVYCDFKHLGCPETMPWGQLKRHTRTCEYGRVDCPNAMLGCDTRPAPADLEAHITDCKYKPVPCKHCDAPNVATCLMAEHLELCPKVEITCLHKCGANMLRGEFQEHLLTCPNKPVHCRFKRMGCDFEGSSEKVTEHESTDHIAHLDMVMSHCDLLEKRMRDLELSQQASSGMRDASEKTLENTLRQQLQKIMRQENILKETQKTIAKQAETMNRSLAESGGGASMDIAPLQVQLRDIAEQLTTLDTSHTRTVTTLRALEEQFTSQSLKYGEFDLRFQILETASYNGVLLWKIGNYEQRKADAKRVGGVQSLYSQAFYTSRHGYRMCARVYLNGDGMGLNNHLSLFFVIMRGEFDALLKWPFRQKVTLMLMDQTGRNRHVQDTFRPDPSSSSFQKPKSNMNIASGCPMFISHDVLEAPDSPYLQDKTIFIKLTVDIADLTSS